MRRLAIVLLLLAACKKGASEPEEEEETPPAKVTCAPVVAAQVSDTVVLRGAVSTPPLAQAVVASPVAGRITKLTVQEGDVVVANQLVAVMEDPTLGASAEETSADTSAAQVELRAATRERVRLEKLVADGISPQKDLDDALAREEGAKAALVGAQARGKLARRQLARTDLRAPRGGTVLRVVRRSGELVDPSTDTTILEIADLSVLELRAQATGADLIGLAPNMAATVTLDAVPGRSIPGTIVAVSPAVDPETSLGTVRVKLDVPAGWAPAIGLPGAASVQRAPRTGITIPPTALRRSIEGADEVLVCTDDHIEVREVEIGVRDVKTVEVTSGLAVGDAIVTDHVLGLEDGTEIAK